MLSEKDRLFMRQWEQDRAGLTGVTGKILRGLPVAMLFSLPIIALVFTVYVFFPEWYTKVSGISAGTGLTIMLAVLISVVFFAYFRMHYKFEVNEQHYAELKSREQRESLSETTGEKMNHQQ